MRRDESMPGRFALGCGCFLNGVWKGERRDAIWNGSARRGCGLQWHRAAVGARSAVAAESIEGKVGVGQCLIGDGCVR